MSLDSEPLVMFSPLPPCKSGIAAYTAELLPALCAQRPVVLVCEQGLTPAIRAQLPYCGDALRVVSYQQYAAEPALALLPHVYQIGNNPDHIFVYEAFQRRPGVLVVHDFNLHYLVEDLSLARGDAPGYRRILEQEHGSAGAALANLRHIGVFSEAQKLILPMHGHLLRRAKGVIVHNRWVYDRLSPELQARTLLTPHHFSPLVAEVDGLSQAEARARRKLPRDGFVVLSLGYITPPKQIQSTLAALARLRDQGQRFFFVVAGERNGGFDIDALVRQHRLEDRVIITGYVPEEAFFELIVAADCLVNLRHPTVGESSGTLARSLALGLPAIVHNFGPSSEYPDDVVLKVPLELDAPVALAAALSTMMNNPPLRAAYRANAVRHMQRYCAVEHSASAYLRFIPSCYRAALPGVAAPQTPIPPQPARAAGSEPAAMTTPDDLVHLYRAFLGREPETEQLLNAIARPLAVAAKEMAASDELNHRVLHPLVQHQTLVHRKLSEAVIIELGEWLHSKLGVAAAPVQEQAQVAALLLRLYSQSEIAERMLLAHGSLFTEALRQLQLLHKVGSRKLVGKIEFVNRDHISGWALDASNQTPHLQIEVRAEGRVVAVASAFSSRPDVLQQHGGNGLAGFRAPWDPAQFPYGRALRFTLHEASTGAPLGVPYRFENNFFEQLSVAQRLAGEFEQIKARLDALAGMVPQALSFAAFPLAHFDLYRRTHQVPPPPGMRLGASAADCRRRFTVLLDASHGDPIAARRSVDSLRQQSHPHWRLLMVGGGEALAQLGSLLHAANARIEHVADWPAALQKAQPPAAEAQADHWLVLLEAGELLDRQALAWMEEASGQRPETRLLFWDEDYLQHTSGHQPGARAPEHVDPILRCRFSPDAMLELNVVGTSFAVRADTWSLALERLRAHPATRALEPPHPASLVERERLIWAVYELGALEHIGHFLLSRTQDLGRDAGATRLLAQASPAALRPLLPAPWRERVWARQPDPLAAKAPKPLVRWQPERPAALISVLIPTRDFGDLVRQCVDSLRQMAAQPEALEILIADNGSTEPETLAYLEQGQAQGLFRVLRIDEAFNWSRLNNLMAEAASGEYLLVLNNDTRMLSPEWDAALRGLLERDDVGAVGARLLYEDLTIQHAGVVFGYEGFVGHEGVHRPHDDPAGLWDTQLTHDVSAATGAFLACRRALFQALGGFEAEQLSVTFNDVEWCVRLRASGLRILYAPLLSLIHYESKSRGFDFMSIEKQRRAEYERHALLACTGEVFAEDPHRSAAPSGWVHAERSLK